MKNISSFRPQKYTSSRYKEIHQDVYKFKNIFVTTLSFIQEPELGEGKSADNISQYPLEDILDKFSVYVSDFYEELNEETSELCYLEFASPSIDNIMQIRTIIGKHVYNKAEINCNEETIKLVIE